MVDTAPPFRHQTEKREKYKFLDASQIEMIDEALYSLGQYGEVHLIVEKGRMRFLVTKKSYDTFKWKQGSLTDFPGNTPAGGK